MSRILHLLIISCLLGICLPDASAQVSVRRNSSTRREASASNKKEKKADKKSDKKSDRKTATAQPAAVAKAIAADDDELPVPEGNRAAATPASRPTPPAAASATPSAARRTPQKKGVSKSSLAEGVTQRQQSFAEYQRTDNSYVPWQHVVYRKLDLTKECNASLYYPQEPQDGLTNLFRVIFDGLCTGRIKGYEYMDGRESFDDKYAVKVQDVLEKFQIMYQQRPGVGQGATINYVVEEMDVPCNEVLAYYIKERWEFNLKNSKYGPHILAICPVLYRSGDFGGEAVPYPMFWVNYEDLRPLLRDHLVMSDGMNNAPRFTMEEFFTLEHYQGEIYKVQNVRGLSLMQQYPDPDTLKLKQAEIEAQLRGFADSIWVYEPSDKDLAMQDSVKAVKRAERRARREGDQQSSATDSKGKKNRRTKEAVNTDSIEDAKAAKEDEIDQRVESTGTAHSARRSARRR